MTTKLLLAGGTGVVGNEVLQAAAQSELEIITVGRRPSGNAATEIVASFADLPMLPAADRAICVLGTTIGRAGSRSAFRAVDYDAVMTFATAAKNTGAWHFMVVTAVGANSQSPVFYSRIKGEVERDLTGLGFSRLDIVRPGLLLGRRQERRPVESLLKMIAPVTDRCMIGSWRRYRSIHPGEIARFLLSLRDCEEPGVFVHHFDEINALPADGEPDLA
jgi:uncharacterized protein YbjT (DUF2867 family)